MMTFILLGIAFALGLVVLANVLPLLALAFTAFVALLSLKAFMKTDSTIAKLWWGSIVFVAVVITVSNTQHSSAYLRSSVFISCTAVENESNQCNK